MSKPLHLQRPGSRVRLRWDIHVHRFLLYLPGNAVDVELDHVFATGVILRVPSSVLRIDDAATHTHTHT